MKIALVSHYTPDFKEMADLTVPDKQKYADKHGYSLFVKTDNFSYIPGRHLCMEKCLYLCQLMEAHPEIEWFWYSGCDCMITNFNIKLELLIDNNYHFIVCRDHGGINGDVFFIRNTPEGREYARHLDEPNSGNPQTEQAQMWDDEHIPKWRVITKYIPQNLMNSYDLTWYPHLPKLDQFGQRGTWEFGDFVLQAVTGYIPGATPRQVFDWKLNILNKHVDKIIR
jgi:hypothetical protein